MNINYEEDFKKLAMVSDVAKMYFSNIYEMTVQCMYDMSLVELQDETPFHPTGKCGCILLDDDYMLGIRCNHLMWAEGFHEMYTTIDFKDNSILIWGNHKGNLAGYMYMFTNRDISSVPTHFLCKGYDSPLPNDVDIMQVHYKGKNDYHFPEADEFPFVSEDIRYIITKTRHDKRFIYDDANGECYKSVDEATLAYLSMEHMKYKR